MSLLAQPVRWACARPDGAFGLRRFGNRKTGRRISSPPLVLHFGQTNPIQPLKLRFSYLFIFAISSAGSGLLSFSQLPIRPIGGIMGHAGPAPKDHLR
jgi:hypothetical protein